MQRVLAFARGARQLVVQEALDTMSSFFGSYFSSFTPITNMGASAGEAAAERMQSTPLSLEGASRALPPRAQMGEPIVMPKPDAAQPTSRRQEQRLSMHEPYLQKAQR